MDLVYSDELATIYHGDCFEVLGNVERFDALITDPPYSSGGLMRADRIAVNSGGKYGRAATHLYRDFGGDNKDQRAYLVWVTLWAGLACQRIAPGGAAAIFADWRQLGTTIDAVQGAGFIFRGIGTWHKVNGRPNRGCFRASSEYVVHATLGNVGNHDYFPDSVLSTSVLRKKRHIAQKPVEVMEWLVQFCRPGGVILDPFMGAGSTLVAAKRLGFRVIGADIDRYWCELAARRLRQRALDFKSGALDAGT